MDRRNRAAPLVDSSACFCRADRSSSSAAAAAARRIAASNTCAQPKNPRASIHPLNKNKPGAADRSRGGGGPWPPLLPGLPDDLAIACLIRVPRADHRNLRLVSRRWRRLLAGNYFYGLRRRLGLAEPWLYALTRSGTDDGHHHRVSWHVLDPSSRGSGACAWRALPPLPREFADAEGFGCAVLGGCHLYLLGGGRGRGGAGGGAAAAMRRVVFYSARSERWHRAPDMLRRRRCLDVCAISGRLYVAGGGETGDRSVEVFDPAKNRWAFAAEMAAPVSAPFVSAVHGGRWYVKGIGLGGGAQGQGQVVSQAYSAEEDAWSVVVLGGMVTGWRGPSASLGGRLYAADCRRDGYCRLRAYDEAADAWATCVGDGDRRQHRRRGSSEGVEAAAIVALRGGRLCVVRNDMSVLAVDVDVDVDGDGEGKYQRRWQTLTGGNRACASKSFVTGLLANLAGGGRSGAKNSILHCQVLEA